MGRRLLAVGECMVEFSPEAEGTYRVGFAGDTFNTAWYARQLAEKDRLEVGYFSAVGDTTAVGDSFNAAFLVEYLERARPREAVRAGCALARHVIGCRGALVPVSKIDLINGKARQNA